MHLPDLELKTPSRTTNVGVCFCFGFGSVCLKCHLRDASIYPYFKKKKSFFVQISL